MNKDRKSSNQHFDWNKIYTVDEKNYAEQLSANREYYLQIDESDYRTVHNCVDHAIREGNHAAFAHFFLKRERSRTKVFGNLLSSLLDERKKVTGYNEKECWILAPVIQQNYWRALDFEYTQDNIFRKIPGKEEKTIAYQIDTEGVKETQQRRNWRTGNAIPTRDVIVQIAICLGISLEDTNRLLRAACLPALYVLDAVDVCSMFMIRENENNYSIAPFEKLAITKEQINGVLRECVDKNLATIRFSDVNLLGGKAPLGIEIDKEIAEIREMIEGGDPRQTGFKASTTFYLTKLFEDRFNNTRELKSFLGAEQTVSDHSQSTYRVFLQKYYGFLHKTKLFIEKTENYEKNLTYSGWTLTANGSDSIRFIDGGNHVNSHRMSMSEGLKQIDKIWHIADLVGERGKEFREGDDWIGVKQFPGAFTIPRQMIEGRKISSTAKTKKGKSFVYEMNFGDKVHLMKFAIATGNEDEAGTYLKLAGVWERDWYEYFKNKKEVRVPLDRSDYSLIYALLYRDKLIEKWSDKKDQTYASKIRAAFPMIKLLLTINRDITLTGMKIADDKNGKMDYDNIGTPYYYEERLIKLQREMVFPIAWFYVKKNVRNKSLNLNIDAEDKGRNDIGLWRWRVKDKQEKRNR